MYPTPPRSLVLNIRGLSLHSLNSSHVDGLKLDDGYDDGETLGAVDGVLIGGSDGVTDGNAL